MVYIGIWSISQRENSLKSKSWAAFNSVHIETDFLCWWESVCFPVKENMNVPKANFLLSHDQIEWGNDKHIFLMFILFIPVSDDLEFLIILKFGIPWYFQIYKEYTAMYLLWINASHLKREKLTQV